MSSIAIFLDRDGTINEEVEYLASPNDLRLINGSAEATTLDDACADAAIAAQAFHWFDVRRARAEMRRIIKPPHRVALLWNDRLTDATPFLQAFEALLVRYGTDYTEVNHRNMPVSPTLIKFHSAHFDIIYIEEKK